MRKKAGEPFPDSGESPLDSAFASSLLPVPDSRPPSRLVIAGVYPDVDHGRFMAKCSVGKKMEVEAVLLCDGHDVLKGDLLYRHAQAEDWNRMPLSGGVNDVWRAAFPVDRYGEWHYTVEATIDRYGTWRSGFLKKIAASEPVHNETGMGLALMREIAGKIEDDQDRQCAEEKINGIACALEIVRETRSAEALTQAEALLRDPDLESLFHDVWDDPSFVRFERELIAVADSPLASCSAWYEFFPRSKWGGIAEEGTFRDCHKRLEYVADMGFDIVYFPPIHPIGHAFRKGKNNALNAQPEDVGSPWAIGAEDGGHKAIHRDLGSEQDFLDLVAHARTLGLEVALDIAFQCSPDHPYAQEHPDWFIRRPDGTIQYAENPPKKYQDIYPVNFESADWMALWDELKSVFEYWIARGIRVFRVDNPHTKAFAFWEWAIREIRTAHPETVFLAEAFTRPHIMAWLAKCGFNQSYTYFAWRTGKQEIIDYMTTLTQTELRHFFRPNFWPNTPDIFTEQLQSGGRGAYVHRLVLAATLSSSYGIYGPCYELMEGMPKEYGKEDYFHSEKYEVRYWDPAQPKSLAPLIRRINAARKENPALQDNASLLFHPIRNDQILAYTKCDPVSRNLVLVIVNLDCHHVQSGTLDFQIQNFPWIDPEKPYYVEDVLTGHMFTWTGWKNFISLDPQGLPAHVFVVRQNAMAEDPQEGAQDDALAAPDAIV